MIDLRILNIASALLFIIGIVGMIYGLQELFLVAYLDEELIGVTASEIGAFSQNLLDSIKLKSHFEGLYILSTALFFCVISLIPYRKGEKWAWYAMLVIGGLAIFGQLTLIYIGVARVVSASYLLPLAIVIVILWIIGLALPAKEILSKTS
ncbi:MAG: hypothetical protein PVG48_04085 [Candidatus Bathyarchaeota archaeon]